MKKQKSKVTKLNKDNIDEDWIILPVLRDLYRNEFKKDDQGNIMKRGVYTRTVSVNEAFLKADIMKVEANYTSITGEIARASCMVFCKSTSSYYRVKIERNELIEKLIGTRDRESIGFKTKNK